MSSVALLLGLLLVAYVGSQLLSGRPGGYRLASGAEYLLLGLALGPLALGVAERSSLLAFQPLAIVGTAWFALVIGADYGYRERGRVGGRGALIGIVLALLNVAATAVLVYAIGRRFTALRGHDLRIVAGGLAVVASETTRHALRLVVGRGSADGKLSRLVADIADADDLVPILGIALLFPALDPPVGALDLPFWAWGLVTLLIGVVLGGTAAALLRSEPRAGDGWGVLIGATLFGVGISWHLGLAPQATTFALGVSLSFLSRHGKELRAMLARSEQAVLLPTLLLAGAEVTVRAPWGLVALLGGTFAARALLRFLGAPVITAVARVPVATAPNLALGLLTSGALSIMLSLAFVSRFPGPPGEAILAVAVGLAVLGELVGPAGLRRALLRVGELSDAVVTVPTEHGRRSLGIARTVTGAALMSHAASAKKGVPERVAQAMALLVVSGVMYGATRAVAPSESASGLVTAMGFLLLSGMLASELLEIVGLPHLTGYLLAGALSGPYVFHLVDHHAVQRLEPVNTLALSLIALAGGTELRIDLLRQVLKSLVWSMVLQSVFGVVIVGIAFLTVARFLPFTSGLGVSALTGIALLWGVLAVCRSPSATLGIFAQLRPDGPVSRFSLAFVMSSDVVVAMLLTAAIAFARPLIEPSVGLSLTDFTDLGREILGSISLGTTLGLLLAAYLWLIGGGLLLVLIAIGFGLTEGLHYLRFDPLLAFMVAGFIVANFSEQGPKLLSAVDRTGGVVYVVFFATAGAHLDLDLIRKLWPVALYLGGVRMLVVWLVHRVASRYARDEPIVRRWGWASLVSQAGLTIGMAVVVERTFPSFGAGFRSLAIANVALNELVGPVLFKFALDRTGESGKGTLEKGFHDAEADGAAPPEPA